MLNYSILPDILQDGMKRYIEDGIPTGDFLRCCLANDFVGALGVASTRSYEYLHAVGMFLWNELPGRGYPDSPWGSYEAVERHIERMQGARVAQKKEGNDGGKRL